MQYWNHETLPFVQAVSSVCFGMIRETKLSKEGSILNRKHLWRFLSLLFVSVCLLTVWISPARSDVEEDVQLWTPVYLNVPITEKFKGNLEIHPRFDNNVTEALQVIVRPSLGYQVNKNLSLWQGVAWIPNFHPSSTEYRVWQQAFLENSFSKVNLSNRLRLEERFLEDVGGVSLRGRYRLQGTFPLGKRKRWALVASDEVFVALNSLSGGPRSGFDQNRLYAGLSRQLNEQLRVEGGYLLQYINRRSPGADSLNHAFVLALNINL